MLQNGKSVYSLWILIPSVSYPFPRNIMWQHGSGSAISRHQFLAEMLIHKVSMTSLHWQTGLQTEKGHALTQFTLVNE